MSERKKKPYRETKPRKSRGNKTKTDRHLRLSSQLEKKNYSRPLDGQTLDDISVLMASMGVKKGWSLTGTWDACQPRLCPSFEPIIGTEEEKDGEMQNTVTTRIQCISAMKEFQNISLEELRLGDHMAGFRYKGFPSGTSLFEEATPCIADKGHWSPVGTKSIKFRPSEGSDEEANSGMTDLILTKNQCITSMPEYEKKSLEELRLEDYIAGLNFLKGFQYGSSNFDNWSESLPGYLIANRNAVVAEFRPMPGTDAMMRSGAQTTISTRHQCITAMFEYETISFEELRLKDYLSGHKGPRGQFYEASAEELKESKIQLDMDVYIFINIDDNEIRQKGKVKFIGRVPEKAFGKLHAGIELRKAVGDGDGVYQGVRLFRTEPNHAKVVPLKDVCPQELLDGFQSDDTDTEDEEESESVLDRELEAKRCIICVTNPMEIYLSPCGHVCCCDECSKKVTSCPICRTTIQIRSKAYLP